MSVKTIDKAFAKTLNAELVALMTPLAAKYGLTIENRGGSFDRAVYIPRLKFKVNDPTTEADRVNKLGKLYMSGFSDFRNGDLDSLYGRPVTIRGVVGKVVDFLPRSTRFPVVVEMPDGKKYKVARAVLMAGGA